MNGSALVLTNWCRILCRCCYAEVISKYEPEMAARWVLTIPAGKERDNSLRIIHRNWPPAKAATRDAFAKENGLTWP